MGLNKREAKITEFQAWIAAWAADNENEPALVASIKVADKALDELFYLAGEIDMAYGDPNNMLEENKAELFRLVIDYIDTWDTDLAMRRIRDAHNGRPDGRLVTNNNLHLFRQYRNGISSAPLDMVNAALDSVGRPRIEVIDREEK